MASDLNQRSCLHLVVTASDETLACCMEHYSEGDSVVFLDEGVLQLIGRQINEHVLVNLSFYFSFEDLQARGLLPKAQRRGVQIADDGAIVQMLTEHPHCLTWK